MLEAEGTEKMTELDCLREELEATKTWLGNLRMGLVHGAEPSYSAVCKTLAWFDNYTAAKSAEK